MSDLRLAFSAWAMRELPLDQQIALVQRAGYGGFLTVEISVMVQRRPDYDPAEVAARSLRTLVEAAQRAGVPLEYREASIGAV